MCFSCALRPGKNNRPNKNSCFVCQTFVFDQSTKYAHTCQFRHNKFNFPTQKCFLCKMPIFKNMNPNEARLCLICSDYFCAMFEE